MLLLRLTSQLCLRALGKREEAKLFVRPYALVVVAGIAIFNLLGHLESTVCLLCCAVPVDEHEQSLSEKRFVVTDKFF